MNSKYFKRKQGKSKKGEQNIRRKVEKEGRRTRQEGGMKKMKVGE